MFSADQKSSADAAVLFLIESAGIQTNDANMRLSCAIAGPTLAFSDDGKAALKDFKSEWEKIQQLSTESAEYIAFQTKIRKVIVNMSKNLLAKLNGFC